MSQGVDLFAPREDGARPNFEVALRGYEKRQVDRYVSRMDRDLSNLSAEHEAAVARIRELTGQLEQMHTELTELRQRPPQVDRASFRDLGPTVDQIMALAEQQAKTITDTAAQRAADYQADAERTLADAQHRAEQLRAESEAAHERAEQEAKRIYDESAQHLEQSRTEAESLLAEARSQAQQELEAARNQTQQEIQARQEALAELHTELDSAQQQLTQSRHEAATVDREVAQLQQRLEELNQELERQLHRLEEARQAAEAAERHAKEVRARVKREAERVAQLAATAVMAAAARGETGEYPMVARGPGDNGEALAGQPLAAEFETGPERSAADNGDGATAARATGDGATADRATAEADPVGVEATQPAPEPHPTPEPGHSGYADADHDRFDPAYTSSDLDHLRTGPGAVDPMPAYRGEPSYGERGFGEPGYAEPSYPDPGYGTPDPGYPPPPLPQRGLLPIDTTALPERGPRAGAADSDPEQDRLPGHRLR